jgi:hypothetical protein
MLTGPSAPGRVGERRVWRSSNAAAIAAGPSRTGSGSGPTVCRLSLSGDAGPQDSGPACSRSFSGSSHRRDRCVRSASEPGRARAHGRPPERAWRRPSDPPAPECHADPGRAHQRSFAGHTAFSHSCSVRRRVGTRSDSLHGFQVLRDRRQPLQLPGTGAASGLVPKAHVWTTGRKRAGDSSNFASGRQASDRPI